MPSSVIVSGSSSPVGISATAYYPCPGNTVLSDTTEARLQTLIRDTYTLGSFFVRIAANTRDGTGTARSRVNTANGAHSVSIPASTTGLFEDTANTNALVATDLLTTSLTITGSSGSTSVSAIAFVLTHASAQSSILGGSGASTALFSAGATSYGFTAGGLRITATETDVQLTVRSAITMAFLRIYLPSNSINTGTSTFRTRINTANGSVIVSVGFGATGSFEDTTNSDSIAAGDVIDYQLITSGSSGSITISALHARCIGLRPFMTAIASSISADSYGIIHGNVGSNATEAQTQTTLRTAFTASQLFVRVTAHAASGGVTVYLRQGGVSTALAVAIAEGATGAFEDTADTINYASGNVINHFVDHGGGAGTITIAILAAGAAALPPTPGILVDWNNDGDFEDSNEVITGYVISARWRRGRDAES